MFVWHRVPLLFSTLCSCVGAHRVQKRADSLPAPIVISPSQFFEGSDGQWSSFELRVGTPSQNVRVFPGSSSTSTVVVVPEGCQNQGTDCANARGDIFNPNSSTTWSSIGAYGLGFEQSLGYTDSGEFGFDTGKSFGLGYQGSGGPIINHTVVTGVAGTNFWIGLLGLNPQPTNFTNFNDPQPSFMRLLKQRNEIPSLSWSYTAGAQYRQKQVLGSLILGGYDSSRFAASDLHFSFGSDQTRDLTFGLQSISTNATGADTSLLTNGINVFIDSSVAHLYLPTSVCEAFESAFGLTYNTAVGLYLVNDTLHKELLSRNPTVTFTIGNTASGGPTKIITLPYASFDLQARYPLVLGNNSRYFPLQRATNETQYTLGRTFLQEAYLTVDYERGNFSVSPCIWDPNLAEHVVPIFATNRTSITGRVYHKGLSSGGLAGVIVGAIALLILSGVGGFWFFIIRPRRNGKSRPETLEEGPTEVGGIEKFKIGELVGQHEFDHHEAEGDSTFNAANSTLGKAELDSAREIKELGSPVSMSSELMSTPVHELMSPLDGTVHEMHGSDVPEMPGEGRPEV